MIYFIIALIMRVFADISKETLPKRRIWVNIKSLVYLTLEYLSLESLVYTRFFDKPLGFCLDLGLLNSETQIGTGVA